MPSTSRPPSARVTGGPLGQLVHRHVDWLCTRVGRLFKRVETKATAVGERFCTRVDGAYSGVIPKLAQTKAFGRGTLRQFTVQSANVGARFTSLARKLSEKVDAVCEAGEGVRKRVEERAQTCDAVFCGKVDGLYQAGGGLCKEAAKQSKDHMERLGTTTTTLGGSLTKAVGGYFGRDARVPRYWMTTSFEQLCHRVDASPAVRDQISAALFVSSHESCLSSFSGHLRVSAVYQVENRQLWATYTRHREHLLALHAEMKTPVEPYPDLPDFLPTHRLDRLGSNEVYLFHGTKERHAGDITTFGLDPRVADMSGLYGAGLYFADQACKSLQYTDRASESGTRVLFLCRVTLGVCHTASGSESYSQIRRAPSIPGSADFCDSVVAEHGVANHGRQVHREFVVYDSAQAYPEYLVVVEG